MDFSTLDIKKEYSVFNQLMPRQTVKISGKDFTYRYKKCNQTKTEVTLVFLAGGTGLSDAFFLLYQYLWDDYSILSFNYPDEFRTNAALADAMAELFHHIGAHNVYLIGQSYGGLIAQVVAKRHPDAVKGLILSSTCSMSNDLNYEGIANIVKMINPKKLEKNLKMDRRIPQWSITPFMKLAFKKVVKDKTVRNVLDSLIREVKHDLTSEYMSLMDTLLGDLMNEFGTHYPQDFLTLDHEVLLFFSKEDHIFCDNLKDALVRIMPHPEVVNDLQGGHLAMMISFDEYAAILRSFLSKRNA